MAILSVSVDGWQAAYNGTPPTFTPDTNPETVALTRTGWVAAAAYLHATTASGPLTNIAETFVINRRVRNIYPNQATDVTTATGFSPANAVALSDYVYSTDTIASVTNGSAKTSPKPVAAWALPDRSCVGNTIGAGSGTEIEIVAFHRNGRSGRTAAAVVFRFTDGTNTVYSSAVSVTEVSSRASDKNALIVYRCPSVDITSLTAGLITCNVQVYPFIGGTASILNSSDQSAAREFSPRYFLKNPSKAANPPLAYVGGSGATDATHAGWSTNAATAAAAPYATVQGAINDITAAANTGVTGGVADACRVRITAGTWVLTSAGTARAQNVAEIVIERAPGVARSAAIVTFGAAAWRARLGVGTLTSPLTEGRVRFSDVTISRTGTLTLQGEAANQLGIVFDDVDYDNGSRNATFLSNSHAFIYGMTATNLTGNSALGAGTFEQRIIRGLSVNLSGGLVELWVNLANNITAPGGAMQTRDATKGGIAFANKFINPGSSTAVLDFNATSSGQTITGLWFWQNLVEVTHTTTSTPALRLSTDTPAFGNTVHCGFGHNTTTGYASVGRHNNWYDNSTVSRTHDLNLWIGELGAQFNIKGDVFSADATKTGNMPLVHGVGCQGNVSQYQTNSAVFSNEMQVYGGLGSLIGTNVNTAQFANASIWTNYQGTTGSGGTPVAGTGGGTYTLVASSLIAGLVTRTTLSHDLAGAIRSTTATAPGAYAAPPAYSAICTAPTASIAATFEPVSGGSFSASLTAPQATIAAAFSVLNVTVDIDLQAPAATIAGGYVSASDQTVWTIILPRPASIITITI